MLLLAKYDKISLRYFVYFLNIVLHSHGVVEGDAEEDDVTERKVEELSEKELPYVHFFC